MNMECREEEPSAELSVSVWRRPTDEEICEAQIPISDDLTGGAPFESNWLGIDPHRNPQSVLRLAQTLILDCQIVPPRYRLPYQMASALLSEGA